MRMTIHQSLWPARLWQDYIHNVPVILESQKPYDSPTPVAWAGTVPSVQLQVGRSGDRIPARFSPSVQIGPGAPSGPLFPWGKAAGEWYWSPPPPNLALMLKKMKSYISTPIWAFMACLRANVTFTPVTWLQLHRKHTNTDTPTAQTAETHWSTRTPLRAVSRLMTSA
jgi:hypothetical protein